MQMGTRDDRYSGYFCQFTADGLAYFVLPLLVMKLLIALLQFPDSGLEISNF
jgi:hypothetical protein